MMVIPMVAILVGLVISIAGIAGRKNDRAKALADMEEIKDLIEEYRLQNGTYPTSLAAAKADKNDPWGRAYSYTRPTKFAYEVYSVGPDGQANTGDDVGVSRGGM